MASKKQTKKSHFFSTVARYCTVPLSLDIALAANSKTPQSIKDGLTVGETIKKKKEKISTNKTKTQVSRTAKESFQIIIGWLQQLRFGGYFVAKFEISQFSHFCQLWEIFIGAILTKLQPTEVSLTFDHGKRPAIFFFLNHL